jgi:hypothetical protein
VASFDRSIPPGGEGRLTLKLETRGYEGRLRKVVMVYTNAAKAPQEMLFLEALVKTAIMVSERIVLLKGSVQETVTRTIEIKGELNKPLNLDPFEYTLENKVKFSIEEVAKEKHYRITFSSIPNTGNSCHGLLKLRTGYAEKPEIVIYVKGRFTN